MRADRKLEVSNDHSSEERNLTEALPMAVVDPASSFFFVVLTVDGHLLSGYANS